MDLREVTTWWRTWSASRGSGEPNPWGAGVSPPRRRADGRNERFGGALGTGTLGLLPVTVLWTYTCTKRPSAFGLLAVALEEPDTVGTDDPPIRSTTRPRSTGAGNPISSK